MKKTEYTSLPVDRRGRILQRGDEVICGSVGSERFIVLGVGIGPGHEVEIYAVGEDDELVCLSGSLCEHFSSVRV